MPGTLKLNARKLFLIDASGALLTALMLLFLLGKWPEFFGMPERAIQLLSTIAFGYAIYSICCFLLVRSNREKNYLMVIAIANILYCLLTSWMIIDNFQNLTILGLAYFMIELLIILILVILELKVIFKKEII